MTYPILLVPGLARFDIFWSGLFGLEYPSSPFLDRLSYFRGIRTFLTRNGYPAYNATLPWAGSVERRAAVLKRAVIHILLATGASKVNLIGHSMGGLDARHMLFQDRVRDRIHRKIASLTTISTPHEGSPFADLVWNRFSPAFRGLQAFSLDLSGFRDVTTWACRAYHHRQDVTDFERMCEGDILFQTYAGRQSFERISLLHRRSFLHIYRLEGDNDGMVSVASAKWCERYFKGVIEGTEHFNEIGWVSPDQLLRGVKPRALLQRIHAFFLDIARTLP